MCGLRGFKERTAATTVYQTRSSSLKAKTYLAFKLQTSMYGLLNKSRASLNADWVIFPVNPLGKVNRNLACGKLSGHYDQLVPEWIIKLLTNQRLQETHGNCRST